MTIQRVRGGLFSVTPLNNLESFTSQCGFQIICFFFHVSVTHKPSDPFDMLTQDYLNIAFYRLMYICHLFSSKYYISIIIV